MKQLDDVVRELLTDRKGKWTPIAKAAKVSPSWVYQFMRGEVPNPGIETLRKIRAAIVKGGAKEW